MAVKFNANSNSFLHVHEKLQDRTDLPDFVDTQVSSTIVSKQILRIKAEEDEEKDWKAGATHLENILTQGSPSHPRRECRTASTVNSVWIWPMIRRSPTLK